MTKQSEVLHALGIHTWKEISGRQWALSNGWTIQDAYSGIVRRVCMDCGKVERFANTGYETPTWHTDPMEERNQRAREIVNYRKRK